VVQTTGDLSVIDATAPDDVWAAGNYMATDGVGYFAQPLLFHWDGSAWSEADLTKTGLAPISNISDLQVTGRDDVWAVGDFQGGNLTPVMLHWDGKAWDRVPVANPLVEGKYTALGVLGPGRVFVMGFGFDDEDGEFLNLSAHLDVGRCPSPPRSTPSSGIHRSTAP